MRYITTLSERQFEVEVIDDAHIRVDNQVFQVDFQTIDEQSLYSLLIDGNSYEASVFPVDEGWQVLVDGKSYVVRVEDERDIRLKLATQGGLATHTEFNLKAPMPGLIIALPVQDGQCVEKGDVLAILESMKMQNELRSPRAGVISRLRVKIGDNVEQKQILLSVG